MGKMKSDIVVKDDLIPILQERTGINSERIEVVLMFFERLILHAIKRKKNVVIDDFIVLYFIEDELHIELSSSAKKQLKR